MDAIKQFCVVGQMGSLKQRLSKKDSPHLLAQLEQVIPLDSTPEQIHARLLQLLDIIERDFDCFEGEHLQVNEALDQYLIDLANIIAVGNSRFVNLEGLGGVIISLGHRGGDFTCTEGVKAIIEAASALFDRYRSLTAAGVTSQPSVTYVADADQLKKLYIILDRVNDFVTAYNGVSDGVPEFAPIAYELDEHPPVTDWVSGLECLQTSECRCGCVLKEDLELLQGMEDFMSGTESPERTLFIEKSGLDEQALQQITGNEAITFDSVKQLAKKGYDLVLKAWENVREWFSTSDDSVEKELLATAENNKKAIQSMKVEGDVKINPNAKKGLGALADKADETGDLSKVVAKLNTPGDAPAVIDGLLGVMKKHSKKSKEITDAKNAAEQGLKDLKALSQNPGSGSDPEAASAAKAAAGEKLKSAKAAVATAKKAMQQQNKITAGIRKAITGLTPHIFVTEGNSGNKKDDNK